MCVRDSQQSHDTNTQGMTKIQLYTAQTELAVPYVIRHTLQLVVHPGMHHSHLFGRGDRFLSDFLFHLEFHLGLLNVETL